MLFNIALFILIFFSVLVLIFYGWALIKLLKTDVSLGEALRDIPQAIRKMPHTLKVAASSKHDSHTEVFPPDAVLLYEAIHGMRADGKCGGRIVALPAGTKVTNDRGYVTYVEYPDGSKKWYHHGKLHRANGPAVESANGTKKWFFHGKLHREDGPAVIRKDGSIEWRFHGQLHRENGPAVERANGQKEWWVNDRKHREDGPAIEDIHGAKKWYYKGRLHCAVGPAVTYSNGSVAWWVHGTEFTEEKFNQWQRRRGRPKEGKS